MTNEEFEVLSDMFDADVNEPILNHSDLISSEPFIFCDQIREEIFEGGYKIHGFNPAE